MLTIYDDMTIAKSDEFRWDDIVMHYIIERHIVIMQSKLGTGGVILK